jgi:hypothetical protein
VEGGEKSVERQSKARVGKGGLGWRVVFWLSQPHFQKVTLGVRDRKNDAVVGAMCVTNPATSALLTAHFKFWLPTFASEGTPFPDKMILMPPSY